jgi:hypothetical protein
MFALLRDKLKSGKTEQAHELKDTQRLKKHLQQVIVARDCAQSSSPGRVAVASCRVLECEACLQVFDQLCSAPLSLQ